MPASLMLQGMRPIDTSSGVEGGSDDDGSALDGASPMSLAAGADFADMVHFS